jgi:chromate transporter
MALPAVFASVSSKTPELAAIPPTISALGLFFLKIGSILYGSGYVLAAFLQGGLVDTRHWLTQTQLLDAIAVGQFTPGPVLSTATFIGYLILGFPGAVVSTVGIFLPSFIYVLAISPFVPKLRKSATTAGFLDGVNAASLGLMLAVCVILGIATLVNPGSWSIFIVAAVVIVVWNFHAAWIVVGAAILGWLFSISGIM